MIRSKIQAAIHLLYFKWSIIYIYIKHQPYGFFFSSASWVIDKFKNHLTFFWCHSTPVVFTWAIKAEFHAFFEIMVFFSLIFSDIKKLVINVAESDWSLLISSKFNFIFIEDFLQGIASLVEYCLHRIQIIAVLK